MCSLLVYRNICLLCVSLVSFALLILSSSSKIFVVVVFSFYRFFGIFYQTIISSANRGVLFFSCLVSMLFISFSFLGVMARAFSTTLSEMIIVDVLSCSQSQEESFSLSKLCVLHIGFCRYGLSSWGSSPVRFLSFLTNWAVQIMWLL